MDEKDKTEWGRFADRWFRHYGTLFPEGGPRAADWYATIKAIADVEGRGAWDEVRDRG